MRSLNQDIKALGCYQDPSCARIETSLTIVHFAFGIFGFLFGLGFYMLFFSKGEEAVLERLEHEKSKQRAGDKFKILLKGLNPFEQEVISAVREQPGITQNTLALRVNMSKAKLSQVLTELEKKELVKRTEEGKTLAIYLRDEF